MDDESVDILLTTISDRVYYFFANSTGTSALSIFFDSLDDKLAILGFNKIEARSYARLFKCHIQQAVYVNYRNGTCDFVLKDKPLTPSTGFVINRTLKDIIKKTLYEGSYTDLKALPYNLCGRNFANF